MKGPQRYIRAALRRVMADRPLFWNAVSDPQFRYWMYESPIDTLLFAFSRSRSELFFIEIGANDAVVGDPLCPFFKNPHWRGIMVEPVPYVFERLQQNYGSCDRFILENSAISESNGTRDFFYLDRDQKDAQMPEWYDKIGSFYREAVVKHSHTIPDIEQRVRSMQVNCITFADLLKKHGVEKIDLILIDVEGYDYEMLKLIDVGRYTPGMVIYEETLLSRDDRAAGKQLLKDAGYEVIAAGRDIIGVQSSELASQPILKEAWEFVQKTDTKAVVAA